MLNAPGSDNILTFHVNRTQGDSYHALQLEISNHSADPALTGWHDYEFVDPSTYTRANDAVNNQ